MPASPAMRCSPVRELRSGNHTRARSLENGIRFKEKDNDLALFNEVQSREKDDFLLQSNDDFEDVFASKLLHFSDYKLGINIPARGESSDILNAETEKNDYEWLITPPDTPLFPSLDDEAPQVNLALAHRGRPRTQPISISRSSTMEKSHRSSRGSASPNRLSPSPRSYNTTLQTRGRAFSATSSSLPATSRPTSASPRPSPPSSKPSTPTPHASTLTPRRLSTGSISSSSRGNSASPKVRAWQSNMPGFSTEVPPNLLTSLADRPASYVRGSSPASRNGRQSKSPTPRHISSSRSKGSIVDDEVVSLPSVGSSERSMARKGGDFPSNKASLPKKSNRTVSSSSAPKRSFDLALRQMDKRKSPQIMFRPLLSSVPSSTFYAGKASAVHRPMMSRNSSVTTSSNASSDLGTSGAHDIEGSELSQDEATSGCVKGPNCSVEDEDEVFMLEKDDSLNENTANVAYDGDPQLGSDDFRDLDSLKDLLVCSRCGFRYCPIESTEEDVKLCLDCKKSSTLSISESSTSMVVQKRDYTLEKERESFEKVEPETSIVDFPRVICKDVQTRDGQSPDLEPPPQLEEHEPRQVGHQAINPSSVSYSNTGDEQIAHTVDFPKSKIDLLEGEGEEGEGISLLLKSSRSTRGPVVRNGNFSASSVSYDDFSYARASTNSSVGRGSVSASSSVDFGPAKRQWSRRKTDMENFKNDMNAKHRRSMSSFSATSSHAFHLSVESFEASVAPQEAPEENHSQNLEDDKVQTTMELSTERQTVVDSGENLLPESPNFEKVEDFGTDTEVLTTSAVEEDSILNTCDVPEVTLDVISEGESDHACLSSPALQRDVSRRTKSSIEELEDARVSIGRDNDSAASAKDHDTSNHSSGVLDESTVFVTGQGGTKGRSLTLAEATDTILFCSSIVHNLAYEAATIAIHNENPQTPFEHNASWPLVPATQKGYAEKHELQSRNTSKRSPNARKSRKTMKTDTTKAPDDVDTGEITDLPKSRIVFPNDNVEKMKPLKLESKCNCRIM